jgi:copper transport protein
MHLRRSIACEIALAIAIVGAASLWRFAGPAMAFVDEPATSLHLHSDKLMAQLELGRDPAGVTRARVVVMGPDFGPIGPRSVMLRLMNPEAGIEPIRYDLRKSSEGGWEGTVLALGDPAGWKVDVEVLIDDFTSAHLEGRLLK